MLARTKIIFFTLFLLIGVGMYAKSSLAGDGSKIHWVSPDGTAAWTDCEKAADPSSNYCALETANTNARGGDTVYLKGGTYSFTGCQFGCAPVNPRVTGNSISSKIVFLSAPGESVVFNKSGGNLAYGIWLGDNPGAAVPINYFKISGTPDNHIEFNGFDSGAYITKSSSHNEIAYCDFSTGGISIVGNCGGGSCGCTDNWIHNNTIYGTGGGNCTPGANQEFGDTIIVGSGYPGGDPNSSYNTIENNIIAYGNHGTVNSYGAYLVFKNNVLHDEPWFPANQWTDYQACNYQPSYTDQKLNGYYGGRNAQFADDYMRSGIFNLIEGNRSGFNSVDPNNGGDGNLVLAGPKIIARYNSIYGGQVMGLYFKYSLTMNSGAGGYGGSNDRVYNNTIYHNGYGYTGSNPLNYTVGVKITLYNGSDSLNVFKNNIVYGNQTDFEGGGDTLSPYTGVCPGFSSCVTMANNWCTSSEMGCTATGDPKFTDPALTSYKSTNLPSLSLQSSSGAIDGGASLTTATASGSNSTTLSLADALYFQDGSWGSDLARGVTLFPDWIAIGSLNNVVKISSINYDTNTITLASPMTWSNGANIWLYKNSEGKQVLYGSAPDYGAYEYSGGGTGDTTPPAAPSGLSVQ